MDDTAADFKEMTGAGLDDADVAGIVEIDEEEVEAPLVDDAVLPVDTDDGTLTDEQQEEEADDMLEYIYGDSLHAQ